MAQFANPIVAILFGAFMLRAETCLHADTFLQDWVTPPTEPPPWGILETGFLVIIVALVAIALCRLVATLSAAGSKA